jgi:hypothetical protein
METKKTLTVDIPEWFKGTVTINGVSPTRDEYDSLTYSLCDGINTIEMNDEQTMGQGCCARQPCYIKIKNKKGEILKEYTFMLPMMDKTNTEVFQSFVKKLQHIGGTRYVWKMEKFLDKIQERMKDGSLDFTKIVKINEENPSDWESPQWEGWALLKKETTI